MDSGLVIMGGIFIGAVAFAVAIWWFDQHWSRTRGKVAVAGTIFIALSTWPFYEAVDGLARGRIDISFRGYIGSFWRSTDGYEFWLAFGFWVGLGLLVLGMGARGLYTAFTREKFGS